MASRNSSVTTSSNTEGNDQYQDDMASDCGTSPYSGTQDDVKMDVANDIPGPETHETLLELQCDELDKTFVVESNGVDVQGGFVEIDSLEYTVVCSRCGSQYHPNEHPESDNYICPECKRKEEVLTEAASLISTGTTPNRLRPLMNISEESNVMNPILTISQLQIVMGTEDPRGVSDLQKEITLKDQGSDSQPKGSCLEHSVAMVSEQLLAEENRSVHNQSHAAGGSLDGNKFREKSESSIDAAEAAGISVLLLKRSSCAKGLDSEPNDSCLEQSAAIVSEQLETQNKSVHIPSHAANGSPDVHKCSKKSDSNIDVAEGTGISILLLKRSSSGKGPLVHSRTLNSRSLSYDDLSYTRDLSSSVMSSTGHGSISTISSVDLSSTRHPVMLVRRHSSGKRSDTSSKPQSTVSSLSGSSMQMYQGLGHFAVSHEENFEECLSNISNIVGGEIPGLPFDHVVLIENTEPSVSKTVLEENSQVSVIVDEDHVLHEVHEGHKKIIGIVPHVEKLAFLESSVEEESTRMDNRVGEAERGEDPTQCSLTAVSEIEINDSHRSSLRLEIDMASKEDSKDNSTHVYPNDNAKALSPESSTSDHADRLPGMYLEACMDHTTVSMFFLKFL